MNCLNCYCHVNRTKRTEVATIWSLAGNHLWAVDRNTSAWTFLMLNKQAGLPVCISRHCLGRKRTDEFNDDPRVGRNILVYLYGQVQARGRRTCFLVIPVYWHFDLLWNIMVHALFYRHSQRGYDTSEH